MSPPLALVRPDPAPVEDFIVASVGELFPGSGVRATAVFRVTRGRETETGPGRGQRPNSGGRARPARRESAAVRLEISAGARHEVVAPLAEALGMDPRDVYPTRLPLHVAELLASCGRLAEPA